MRERVAEAIKSIVEFYRDDNEENPTYKRAHIDQMIEEITNLKTAHFEYVKTTDDSVMSDITMTLRYLQNNREPDLQKIEELWQ
ncbi:hypothetical protein DQS94_12985 [Salmonella enterica subsp. enterica serovar Potsdam]|uniref:Uncharacterized protein n=1 Tax=Salmonella enterica I TaxID=59201 RepID=A0A3U3IZ85_SALET|nr:hypothetical protein [Salmonella enterica subsp. enterica serovar Potsdam]EBP3999592.1 hypothetical protein [Salmonella enterica subsp. enterica]EBX0024515.1 hypothetical protein [Salmonella enterica subsp. enterica serovar Potsdam]ECJ2224268.1 hypothetical protein [Salmonella enterica]EIQ2979537.1 hypothetical protein [Salmonella enterica]